MLFRRLNTLFIKIIGIFAVAIFAVFAAVEAFSVQSTIESQREATADEASMVTKLLAMQIGGSIKFKNTAATTEIVESAAESAGSSWAGGYVVDSDGQVLYPSGEGATEVASELSALAAQAIETGEIQVTADNMTVVNPVIFGKDDAIVGAIATQWTAEPAIAASWSDIYNAIGIAFGMFLMTMVVVAVVLQRWISKPLVLLEGVMARVASGDYDLNVPSTGRGDEIGKIARRLENFRTDLKAGEGLAKDSAYKSSAFQGSSAALMVVDKDFKVIYHNPAFKEMVVSLGRDMEAKWGGTTADSLLGSSLRSMAGVGSVLDDIAGRGKEAFPATKTLAVGKSRITLSFNAALDDKGEMTGAVIELADETDQQNKAAMVSAVDTAMLRAEFGADGTLMNANENFTKMVGVSSSAFGSLSFNAMFIPDGSETTAPLKEKQSSGRFIFRNQQGSDPRYADGSFVAVQGLDGSVEKTVFIGMDMSAIEVERQAAEAKKQKEDEEQSQVVDELGRALKDLSAGRLDVSITQAFSPVYERLRTDFNSAVTSLNDAISVVMQNTNSIRSETGEITSAADDLSRRTERQAATLEETAAALDQLTKSVRSAADGAQGASEKAGAAQARAEEGGKVAREAVNAMDGIKNSSQEISKITSVIDDIAFQTNLLALNAGVEAARAGEAGRGFAVVATEVRALAQRSSDAAREINDLISSSETQVQSGVELVDRTGTALSAIVESISEISGLVSNIALSTKEQASGLNEINSAVTELDQVTQQNAAMFEETTAASHALTTEADSLAQAVSRFSLGGGARVAAAPARPEPRKPAEQPAAKAPVSEPVAAVANGSPQVAQSAEDLSGWEEF